MLLSNDLELKIDFLIAWCNVSWKPDPRSECQLSSAQEAKESILVRTPKPGIGHSSLTSFGNFWVVKILISSLRDLVETD